MKDRRTIKLEIAGELLKLEAKLCEAVKPTFRNHADNTALEEMRKAHDSLLKA